MNADEDVREQSQACSAHLQELQDGLRELTGEMHAGRVDDSR